MQTKYSQRFKPDFPVPPGFTLIELLVVIGIITLLIAILLPVLGSARAAGKQAVCLSNQRQIGTAFTSYFADQRSTIPYAAITLDNAPEKQYLSWDDFLQGYGLRTRDNELRNADGGFEVYEAEPVLTCPSDPVVEEDRDAVVRSYAMTRGSPPRIGPTSLWDDGGLETGTAQVFDDSATETEPPGKWLRVTKDVPAPSDTFLVVENPARTTSAGDGLGGANFQGAVQEAFVTDVRDITPRESGGSGTYVTHGSFHDPLYSFLHVDGSAELRNPQDTIGTRQGADAASPATGWTRTAFD